MDEKKKKEQNKKEQDSVIVEIEGDRWSWFYVCGDCHGQVNWHEPVCSHCGRELNWNG